MDDAPPPRADSTRFAIGSVSSQFVELDGSEGEGGGQILRTALSLSMLTGRPFRIVRIRANRDRPGLRPQHLAAVRAASRLSGAEVEGAAVGSTALTFCPLPFRPEDQAIDIGTAGATSLVLHTLALPIALAADRPVRLCLDGGTFNEKAPSYPYLEFTWRKHLSRLGLDVALAMPSSGFYPRGGGRLEAWIEPGRPRPFVADRRGTLVRISGVAGSCRLGHRRVADRLRDRALELLDRAGLGVEPTITLADWPGLFPGAALALVAEHDGPAAPATFVGLGERGKPAERVAEEAVAELLEFLHSPGAGAVDPHAADQILLPLALAEGRSIFTASKATEHLRTNARTISRFLDVPIRIEEEDPGPTRVIIG
ncbi:RNA 3'-terminal phosphate cyclase [Tautonia sociabilis]|uniref:RNA 3'-terminal phosphate cyclase n=1 Tax=Tautonia sociabilis TaxID=2080755 RepID=A0A432MPY4_9BACT|nr:RNA 3'-terminal phosphate cyclase [Tautonia sociabilis]RUL89309.1 RNA 3'-phosphate cyclase [Tautonia sociabilis]